MGKNILSMWLFCLPCFAGAGEIGLQYADSMYGAGEVRLPCTFESIDTICKLDTGILFSRLNGIEIMGSLELINVVATTSVTGEQLECPFYKTNYAAIGSEAETHASETMGVVNCVQINNRPSLAGLDFLWKRVFSLDVKNLKLDVDTKPLDPETAQLLGRDKVKDSIIVPFLYGRDKVKVMGFYDTGASITVVSKEYVKQHPEDFHLISSTNIGEDIFGNPITNDLVIISWANFQGKKVVAEYAMAIDFTAIKKNYGEDVEFIIGMNWIKDLKWTFDLEQNLFKVD